MDMDRYIKMVFKCDKEGCDEKFTLNDFERHVVICSERPQKCLFGCEDQTQMKGSNQHLQHAETTCPNVLVNCHICDIIIFKSRFGGHDCL